VWIDVLEQVAISSRSRDQIVATAIFCQFQRLWAQVLQNDSDAMMRSLDVSVYFIAFLLWNQTCRVSSTRHSSSSENLFQVVSSLQLQLASFPYSESLRNCSDSPMPYLLAICRALSAFEFSDTELARVQWLDCRYDCPNFDGCITDQALCILLVRDLLIDSGALRVFACNPSLIGLVLNSSANRMVAELMSQGRPTNIKTLLHSLQVFHFHSQCSQRDGH
jgi:hypothetical protein